jgi:hypothetical protein
MSESAGKTFRGLQEAYASIYANKSENLTEDTIVNEVQEEQEFEIDENKLYETVKHYLIHEGFAKTEEQAVKMIPHIGENWLNGIISYAVLAEDFLQSLETLAEEGYDWSSYTEEDLFETYIKENHSILSEQLAGDMPGLGWLRGLTGIFGAGAASRAVQTKPRPYRTRPEGSAVDYGQMTLEKPKPKPAPVVKAQVTGETERPRLRGTATRPSGSTETQPGPAASTPASSTPASSTPAPGGGGGGDNGDKKPDKKPDEDYDSLALVKKGWRALKGLGDNKVARELLGKPARGRFFGKTPAGQGTRAAATSAVSGLDIAGTLADPAKQTKSRIAQLGSLGPGFVGTVSQGLGYAAGGGKPTGGGGLERGLYQFGKSARQLGREMRDQPWTKKPNLDWMRQYQSTGGRP